MVSIRALGINLQLSLIFFSSANFTLDPRLLDLQAPDLTTDSALRVDNRFGHSSTSIPASFDLNLNGDNLATSIPTGPGVPGEPEISSLWDLPELSSQLDLLSGPPSDAITDYSTQNSTSNFNFQELEHSGSGIESLDLRNSIEHNSSNLPSNEYAGLPRRRSQYFINRSGQNPTPVFVPNTLAMNPMERWQESPPEDEPASLSAIMDAVKYTTSHRSSQSRRNRRGARSNAFRHYRQAQSTTSRDSSASSGMSASSDISNLSSRDSSTHTSSGRAGKLTRRRPKAVDKPRIFCCTFCCDKFKSKYDWARHEKSLHLNTEAWYCAPHGTTVFSSMTGRHHCAFCNILDPNQEHLESHNSHACRDDEGNSRSFRRKDHLVQHLNLVHFLDTLPLIDDWKIGNATIPSRCGFCEHTMTTWQERVDHLAGHFRKGFTMSDWRGEHGFPPSIVAQITNALPPYLIGSESQSLVPFSATNTDVQDHFAQISSRAHCIDENQGQEVAIPRPEAPSEPQEHTFSGPQLSSFTDVLTLHLSRYFQQKVNSGATPTDEMLQQEARRVLYDSEDSWNQTIADNPEWLSAFRNLYCEQQNGLEPKN